MQEILKKINYVDREHFILEVEMHMLVNSKMIKKMAMGYMFGKIIICIRDNGQMIKDQDMVYSIIKKFNNIFFASGIQINKKMVILL